MTFSVVFIDIRICNGDLNEWLNSRVYQGLLIEPVALDMYLNKTIEDNRFGNISKYKNFLQINCK